MKGKHYVFMDETPGAAGGGVAAPLATPAPTAAPTAEVPTATAPSALSAGQPGTPDAGAGDAAAVATPWGFIPEKFQVKNAAGELDGEASARKVEEHRANLEKRLGEGGVRPKTAAEYKLPELPEALKDMALDDTATAKFREDAHKMGLSQPQFEAVMQKYFEMAPSLVNAGQQLSVDDTVGKLKEAWGKDYSTQAAHAWRGVNQIAQIAGLTVAEVESELGNSPTFNRIMAAVGSQLREDTSVNPGGTMAGNGGLEEVATLQASEAFRNPKHPQHASTVAKWNAAITRGVPDTPLP